MNEISSLEPGVRQHYRTYLREDGHESLERFLWDQERFFAGVDLEGKRVLEIGSGKGLTYPGTWKLIFREAGFSAVTVSYPLPFRLRTFGPVVANPLMNYFLMAGFVLHAHRPVTTPRD